MALNNPFSKIVGLMVLVSFHKEMHTQPCGTEFSFLSEGWALWYWFLFINKCTPSPVALNFPFSQIVCLMVFVSFCSLKLLFCFGKGFGDAEMFKFEL